MTAIRGWDVSHHQAPDQFDWPAIEQDEELKFIVARASYGKGTADRQFARFADLVDEHKKIFGAYLFYRQVHSVEDQLNLFSKQIEAIGGLRPGDMFPVLDMETNEPNGDGKPNAKVFSEGCRKIAEAWRHQYGGVILYFSAYFVEWLKGADTSWMRESGTYYWVADYNKPEGSPRNPYFPTWQIHQPNPRTSPYYAKGKIVIDHDVLNSTVDLKKLLIPETVAPQVSDDTKKGDADTNTRPGGAFPDEVFDGFETMRNGAAMMAAGLDVVLGMGPPGRR
jgi:Glycosyl hydrolases family 25